MKNAKPITIGLEIVANYPELTKKWGNCALLSNPASVDHQLTPALTICSEILQNRLRALFGPQHGIWATVQDNMIETSHARHPRLGIPIYSLYSETREPTEEMLRDVDTLILDMQLSGCRVYTFKWTIRGCLRAAKKWNKKVVILDRPNPLGGMVLEGRCLDLDATSFVGEVAMPMRHGLTSAEAGLFFNATIGADLEVVQMRNWNPSSMWGDLARPWVLTSPNLPTPDAVYVYPGMVLFEGTNISEGRGTGLPFQLIGAPYISDPKELIRETLDYLGSQPAGVHLREAFFQPTSGKWQGQHCAGVNIHVLDPQQVRSFDLALALLHGFQKLGGKQFSWKQPPYEYNFSDPPIDLILGTHQATQKLNASNGTLDRTFWNEGISDYAKEADRYLLYPRERGMWSQSS